jgi:hypothetical protein
VNRGNVPVAYSFSTPEIRHRERLLDGEVGDLRDVDAEPLEHVPEVGAEPQGVEAARHRVGEPRHPARQEPVGVGRELFTHR